MKILNRYGKILVEDHDAKTMKELVEKYKSHLCSGAAIRRVFFTNLCEADFSHAKLYEADFSHVNLRMADFSYADLRMADFSYANLSGANFSGADLSYTDLSGASLSGADLRETDLSGVNLHGTNLSGALNLLSAAQWMRDNFTCDKLGILVYKNFGFFYKSPEKWEIKSGSFITEAVNPDRSTDCGCGINFGTIDWQLNQCPGGDIWKCRIRYEDLPDVVVPFNTDGKARCARLELLEIVDEKNQ